ncbi:thioesterase domain-containing protein, partial [Yinghuangia sp. YIM S10712]|uniref:thioesterase domain-containing protein n=1 Tax=Yinghuangia sp. YIM S10712 TaxID=3436930 RepID=UPI003F5364E1
VSAVTGAVATAGELASADYWVEHVRKPVRFLDAANTLAAQGVRTYLEVGPDGVLAPMIADALAESGAGAAVPLLRADRDEPTAVYTALAHLFTRGVHVDWTPLFTADGDAEAARPRRVDLPTYAFQHRRFWLDAPEGSDAEPFGRPTAAGPGAEPGASAGPSPVREWLADLDATERLGRIRELVVAHLIGVLGLTGLEGADDDRSFSELGLNSLTASELRHHLNAATGLRLSVAAVFRNDSVASLARYITDELAAHQFTAEPSAPGPAIGAGDTPLLSLFRQACTAGRAAEGIRLLAAAAELRGPAPTDESDTVVDAVRYTADGEGPPLICLPSLVAPAHPVQFARFAEEFRGRRPTTVLAPPGYGDKEFLPASRESAVRLHANAVRDTAGGGPFVLVGYSSGGWLAHAVAEHMERDAAMPDPSAVVLLDSYVPDDPHVARLQAAVYRDLADRADLAELVDDAKLAAMGRYLGVFGDWTPQALRCPVLLVAAARFTGTDLPADVDSGPDPVQATWPTPHERVVVAGTHTTLIEEHASGAALAVRTWLDARV